MEKKIVIKCGYLWQLICWILAFLGINISIVGLQLDPNCYKMNNEKKTNDTKFHLIFSFKYGCQYPTLHNATRGNWMLAFVDISLCNVCVYPKVTSFNSCQSPFTLSSNTLELSLKWSSVWTFNFTFNLQFHLRLLGILEVSNFSEDHYEILKMNPDNNCYTRKNLWIDNNNSESCSKKIKDIGWNSKYHQFWC
jgi:hypothetical protein